jgi:hypothetical protein
VCGSTRIFGEREVEAYSVIWDPREESGSSSREGQRPNELLGTACCSASARPHSSLRSFRYHDTRSLHHRCLALDIALCIAAHALLFALYPFHSSAPSLNTIPLMPRPQLQKLCRIPLTACLQITNARPPARDPLGKSTSHAYYYSNSCPFKRATSHSPSQDFYSFRHVLRHLTCGNPCRRIRSSTTGHKWL